MSQWIAGACFLAGATLAMLAGVGVVRMPDVFTRMQASTKASTLGLGFLLLGLVIEQPALAIVMRAVIIVVFMMLTSAVAAHVIARAAALTGSPLWEGTRVDERPERTDQNQNS